jgi:hypothetical protein
MMLERPASRQAKQREQRRDATWRWRARLAAERMAATIEIAPSSST